MKAIAINGSPRKHNNTAQLLEKALEGVSSRGGDTELIHLADLNFKGCISCFSCKRKDAPHGKCAMRDDLSPVLESIKQADIVILGSPIYFMTVTSGMAAFLERLCFSNSIYSLEVPTVFPKRIASAFIYTMNIKPEQAEDFSLAQSLRMFQWCVATTFKQEPELQYVYNTYQYPDYDKYEHSVFSPEEKAAYRATQFPKDLEAAYALGQRLAAGSL